VPGGSPVPDHAIDLIIDTARQHQGELMLAVIGPQTNLALALRKEPRLADWVREVTVMAGSAGGGNITPAAEFNVYCDPEAAAAVFSAPWPIRMVGYDITRTVGIDAAQIQQLRDSEFRTAAAVADLLDFYRARQGERHGLSHAPMHDSCALIPLLDPSSMEYVKTRVEVELAGRHTRGMTVCDLRGAPVENPNVRVAVEANHAALLGHMMHTVLSYP